MRTVYANPWPSPTPALFLRLVLAPACLLLSSLAIAGPGRGACADSPAVFMDESTAASHLVAKRGPGIPADAPRLFRLERVVLWLTVDRSGRICDLTPALGSPELIREAIQLVRTSWKYRRFLIDWKPATVQFPVTLWLVASKSKTESVATARPFRQERAGQGLHNPPWRVFS